MTFFNPTIEVVTFRLRGSFTDNSSLGYHVQHVCHALRTTNSATHLDRVFEGHLFLVFFHRLKPLNDEGGEEIGVPREPPPPPHSLPAPSTKSSRKCHIPKLEISNPDRDSKPHSSLGDGRTPGNQRGNLGPLAPWLRAPRPDNGYPCP